MMLRDDSDNVVQFGGHAPAEARDFAGREWVFGALDAWLGQCGPRFFLLTGGPGSGKSAIAFRLTQFAQPSHDVVPPPGMEHLAPGFLSATYFCSAADRWSINPRAFAQSLALQLSRRYPAFAEAVAEKSGDRKVIIESEQRIERVAEGGTAYGVYIHRLDVSGVAPEDAFIRVVREPLEALFRQQQDVRVTILVDGLDESAGYSQSVGIISLLTEAAGLPDGVRFIVTSRPEVVVVGPFEAAGAQHFSLSTGVGRARSQADIEVYVRRRLGGQPQLLGNLAANLSPEEFVAAARDKADGNFLYAQFLFEMLAAHPEPLSRATLDRIPKGLSGIYREYLRRLLKGSKSAWKRYQRVLGLLAVAFEPLTAAQLSAFAGMKEQKTWAATTSLLQVLEADAALPASRRTFAIYHQSFAQFLVDKDQAEEFWIDKAEQHARVGKYFRKRCGGDWAKLGDDRYARHYLAAHMAGGGLRDYLYDIVAAFTKAGEVTHQAWASVHFIYEGNYTGYLADLSLLRRRTEREYDLDSNALCAFITGSVRSMSDLPPKLLLQLVKVGTSERRWDARAALENVRQMTDPWTQARSVVALSGLGGDIPAELAFDIAGSIPGESSRAAALGALAGRLPDHLLDRALRAALRYEDSEAKADLLTAVARRRPTVWSEALAAIGRIESGDGLVTVSSEGLEPTFFNSSVGRVRRLSDIATDLPDELLAEARALIEGTAWGYGRVGLLATFARRLPQREQQDLWRRAVSDALEIEQEYYRSRAIILLAPVLPDAFLGEVYRAASELTDVEFRAAALASFLKRLDVERRGPAVAAALSLPEAIKAKRPSLKHWPMFRFDLLGHGLPETPDTNFDIFSFEHLHVRALAAAAPYVSAEEYLAAWRAALDAVRGLPDEAWYAKSLIVMSPHVPAVLARETLTHIERIADDEDRGHALVAFAGNMSDGLAAETLSAAARLSSPLHRSEALNALAPRLGRGLASAALPIARTLDEGGARAAAMINVSAALTPAEQKAVCAEALAHAAVIADDEESSQFLTALGEYMPLDCRDEVFAAALAAARRVGDNERRIRALTAAYPHLTPGQQTSIRQEALDTARGIKPDNNGMHGGKRAQQIALLIPYFPAAERPGLLAESLSAARDTDDEPWDRLASDLALAMGAPALTEEQKEQALELAAEIKDGPERARVVARLVPFLSDELLGKAHSAVEAAAWEDDDEQSHSFHLSMLDDWASLSLLQAVAIFVMRLLPEKGLPEGFLKACGISEELVWAEILYEGATHLGAEEIEQVRARARTITDDGYRAYALSAYAAHLAAEEVSDLLAPACTIRDRRTRAAALDKLTAHLPQALPDVMLEAARKFEDDSTTLTYLRAVAGRLNDEQAAAALEIAGKFAAAERVLAFAVLNAARPRERSLLSWDVILADVSNISDEKGRASTLKEVSNLVPGERLADVLRLTLDVANDEEYVNVLDVLSDGLGGAWPARPDAQLAAKNLWLRTIHNASLRGRPVLLKSLRALMPWFAQLDSGQHLNALFKTYRDITRCWS